MQKIEEKILALLNKMWETYISGDFETYKKCYVNSPELVNIAPGELLIGYDNFMKHINTSTDRGKCINITWHRIQSKGDIAWIAATYIAEAIINNKLKKIDGKMSAVFEKIDGGWKIIQSHYMFI